MASYAGAMTIVLPDGTLIEDLEGSLVVPEEQVGDEPWFGTVKGDFDPFDLMEGAPTIRLPDGREATFKLSRTDLVLPRDGIPIIGTQPLA